MGVDVKEYNARLMDTAYTLLTHENYGRRGYRANNREQALRYCLRNVTEGASRSVDECSGYFEYSPFFAGSNFLNELRKLEK